MTTRGLLSPLPRWREFTDLGVVAPSAKLHFYEAGTTTPATTYSNIDLSDIHENTNPLIASAGGLFGPIYLAFGTLYDVVLTESDDTPIWSQANVGGTGVAPQSVFDVTEFGAIGNGSTDDTVAVQAAITAAAVSGGVVYFPTGTYRLTAALSLTSSHVRFLGSGRNEAILVWDDNATAGLQIIGPATTGGAPLLSSNAAIGDYDVVVASAAGLAVGQDAYLQDNSSLHGTLITKIQTIVGTTVTLENALPIALATANNAQLFAYTGLLLGISIRNLSFTCTAGSGTANKLTLLELRRCMQPEVVDCLFDGSVAPLITTVAVKGGNIRDSVFRNANTIAGTGVEAQTSTALSITNCFATRTQFGFVAARSPYTRIEGCAASTIVTGVNIGRAVKVSNGSNFSTVVGVPGRDANLVGVRFENSAYCSITGCTVAFYSAGQNGAGGIEVTGAAATAHHVTIAGNTVVGGNANAAGIALVFDVAGLDTFCVVTGNNISGCKRYGIYCGNNHNVIEGNQVGSADSGALIYVPALCGNNIIGGNLITRESGTTAAAIHTSDGIGGNLIGPNLYSGADNYDVADTLVGIQAAMPFASTTQFDTPADTNKHTAWTFDIPANRFTVNSVTGFEMHASLVGVNTGGDVKLTVGATEITIGASANGGITLDCYLARFSATVLTGYYRILDTVTGVRRIANFSATVVVSSPITVTLALQNQAATAGDLKFFSGICTFFGCPQAAYTTN